MPDDDDRDYEVGYGRPPKHSRFKKGQSGNPMGRKKGGLNLLTILHRELQRTIEIREGDDRKRVTKLEAIVKGLVLRALKGDPRALSVLFDRAQRHFGGTDDETAESPGIDDQKIIDRFLASRTNSSPKKARRSRRAREAKDG
jgi:hypothetical protein